MRTPQNQCASVHCRKDSADTRPVWYHGVNSVARGAGVAIAIFLINFE